MIKGYRLKSITGDWYMKTSRPWPTVTTCAAEAQLFRTREAATATVIAYGDTNHRWQVVAVRAKPGTWGVWGEPLYIHATFAEFINDRPLTLKEAKSLLAYHLGQNECWKYSIKRMPAPKEWCIRKTYPVSFPSKESAETAIVDNASGFFHGGLAAWHAAPLK